MQQGRLTEEGCDIEAKVKEEKKKLKQKEALIWVRCQTKSRLLTVRRSKSSSNSPKKREKKRLRTSPKNSKKTRRRRLSVMQNVGNLRICSHSMRHNCVPR